MIRSFGLSDKGKMRLENEDSFLMDDDRGVYAVADGLGGLPEGSLASSLAIMILKNKIQEIAIDSPIDFQEIFQAINLVVYEKGHEVSGELGIGTTLTVFKVYPDQISVGHVGDCALFLRREGLTTRQVTIDHTMEAEIRSRLKPGEEVNLPEYFSHTLTRCIGQYKALVVDTFSEEINPGDRLLLCSDGISKIVPQDDIDQQIDETVDPESFIRTLVDTANDNGGPDNATGIGVFIET